MDNRWRWYMTEPVGPDYTQEQMEADAAELGRVCMERREVLTPGEAAAYAAGIHETPAEGD